MRVLAWLLVLLPHVAASGYAAVGAACSADADCASRTCEKQGCVDVSGSANAAAPLVAGAALFRMKGVVAATLLYNLAPARVAWPWPLWSPRALPLPHSTSAPPPQPFAQAWAACTGRCVAPMLDPNATCAEAGLGEGVGTRYSTRLTPLGGSGVSGNVTVVLCTGGTAIASGHAIGLEPSASASTTGGPANACGVHIHAGYACANSTSQGGHLWEHSASPDPWAAVEYSSDGGGQAQFTFSVDGVAADLTGKPFIVHNAAGGRVACGLLHT